MRQLKRWLRKLLCTPVLAGAALLLFAGTAYAAGGGHHLEPLTWSTINWWDWSSDQPPVGWFMVDFGIFALLIWWYGRGPVRETFAQRHLEVKRALEKGAKALADAESRYEEYKGKLANVEDEANQFVEGGRTDGALERDQIIQSAKEYAERMRKDSGAVQQQEIDKALSRLRREVATEVLRLTEESLRSELTDGDRNRLIEDAIGELENGKEVARVTERMSASERPRAGGAA